MATETSLILKGIKELNQRGALKWEENLNVMGKEYNAEWNGVIIRLQKGDVFRHLIIGDDDRHPYGENEEEFKNLWEDAAQKYRADQAKKKKELRERTQGAIKTLIELAEYPERGR